MVLETVPFDRTYMQCDVPLTHGRSVTAELLV